MSNAKKILYKLTLGVLIFLIVCTFLSKSIATSIQPEVEVINPVKTDLTVSDEYTGEVIYDGAYEIIYDFPVKITNVSVKEGNTVSEGDVLAEVEAREYYLEMKRKELNILKVKNMIAQTSDNNLLAELKLQADIEEEELRIYKEKYPTDGKIYADMSGIVYSLNAQPGKTINPGVSLVGVYDNKTNAKAVFNLPEKDAEKYNIKDEVILYYEENKAQAAKETAVGEKEYDAATNTYRYSAQVKSDYLTNKQSVPLAITHRTELYDTVIPYRAIISLGANKYGVYVVKQRQGLFGLEYYSKFVEVNIIAVNNLYAAIGGWSITSYDDVVISSSTYLMPGETVRVTNK
ncbi:MAG: HlyD family efflux transporter periplasmic adaptor subunit [Oscillospiraceae bacterium]|nr:HlyD family efflux transporter periplasmic adaptor subunit [Oscillospiraceae bacterium]